jgi:hypothetical protein
MDLLIEVTGLPRLDRQFGTLVARGSDLEPALEAVGEVVRDINRSRFQSEGDGQWAPLAPSTVRQRGSAHPILDDTGGLKASLTRRGARGAAFELTNDSVTVGSDLDSARYAGRRREPVKVTAADEKRLAAAVQRHLGEGP